jgi:thiol-disulfide isomerase/thioredoxin
MGVFFYIYVIPHLNKAINIGTNLIDQIKDGGLNLKKACNIKPSNKGSPEIEGFQHTPEVTIKFFFADWCPHCTAAKPKWADMISVYSDTFPENDKGYDTQYFGDINKHKVVFDTVDCTNKSDRYAQQQQEKYNVSAYPTIIYIKGTDVKVFENSVTSENLQKWLEKII